MNNTLVVIDMQDRFVNRGNAKYAECIDGVARQIVNAKRRNDHIIIVEFDDKMANKTTFSKVGSKDWPTVGSINRLLQNYSKRHYVFKKTQDGGAEVLKTLRDKRIALGNIRVAGVYASYCVEQTVQTLATTLKNSKINLIKDAISCYNGCPLGRQDSFNRLRRHGNVQVIG